MLDLSWEEHEAMVRYMNSVAARNANLTGQN